MVVVYWCGSVTKENVKMCWDYSNLMILIWQCSWAGPVNSTDHFSKQYNALNAHSAIVMQQWFDPTGIWWLCIGVVECIQQRRESQMTAAMNSIMIPNATSWQYWTPLDDSTSNPMLLMWILAIAIHQWFQSIWQDYDCTLVLKSPREATWVHITVARAMIRIAQLPHKLPVDNVG